MTHRVQGIHFPGQGTNRRDENCEAEKKKVKTVDKLHALFMNADSLLYTSRNLVNSTRLQT